MGGVASALLPPAQADIAGNRVEPARLAFWIAQLVAVPPGFVQRFLREVFGSLAASGELLAKANEPCPFAGESGLGEDGWPG
jgi:hypothetical protein